MNIVIFTGGSAPRPEKTQDYFRQIQTIDYVVAADSGLDTLDSFKSHYEGRLDFTPDCILGDMDSIKDKSLLDKFKSSKIESCSHDKDFSDTELALMHAYEIKRNKGGKIIMIGGNGGRVDHFFAIYDTFKKDFHADAWLTDEQAAHYLSEGSEYDVSNAESRDRISFKAIETDGVKPSIHTNGLKWESNLFRNEGMASLSNEISEETLATCGVIKIHVEKGSYLMFLPYTCIVSKR